MRTVSSKKLIAAIGSAAVLVAGSGVAYAYWTTTGAGTSTAVAKATNGTLVLKASGWTDIAPGTAKEVSFTASNASQTDLRLGTITSVVTTSDAGCLPADFTIAAVPANQTILAGAVDAAVTAKGSLVFANSALSQDACKNAVITLTLSSN
jgi:hypothetical protein